MLFVYKSNKIKYFCKTVFKKAPKKYMPFVFSLSCSVGSYKFNIYSRNSSLFWNEPPS